MDDITRVLDIHKSRGRKHSAIIAWERAICLDWEINNGYIGYLHSEVGDLKTTDSPFRA